MAGGSGYNRDMEPEHLEAALHPPLEGLPLDLEADLDGKLLVDHDLQPVLAHYRAARAAVR